MARRVLDELLDSWEAEAPPEGFAAQILDLAGERGNGLRNAELQAANRPAEACLDAWEAQGPPQGFADRVMGVAAQRYEGLRTARPGLDAWEGERPPQGFAERVVGLAERRQRARGRARAIWAAVAAMAAIVAGLLVKPLPMLWNHPGQVASTSVPAAPAAPQPALEPAATMQGNPVPRAVSPSMEPAPRPSPTWKGAADKTARKPLKQPLPIARPAPVVARRTPEPPPRFVERDEPAPRRVAMAAGGDTKEAAFDLVAYKRARASALHREKRFNKTEGTGSDSGAVTGLRLRPGELGQRGLQWIWGKS